MFKYLLLTVSFFSFLTMGVIAQEDLEKDKQALRDLKTVYENAMTSGDLSALKPLLAKDFSAIMITGNQVNSYSELDAFWKKSLSYLGDDAKYSVKIDPDDSLFFGDIALSSGSSSDQVTGSTDLEFTTSWSAVSQKQADGAWKILRIQVTTHPVENPFAKKFYQWKTIIYSITAFIIALIIGYMLGKKKRS